MIKFLRGALIAVAVLVATPQLASAQNDIPGFDSVLSQTFERNGELVLMREAVEMTQGNMKFYADRVEYHVATRRMVATGNVLLIEPDHQIAADKADFDPNTRLGTFYNARGFAKLGTSPEVVTSGPIDPDVQFYGETLEKVSDDTYVITNGGFTSCVQASPRWQMTSGSLRLRVDHYALLRNMMLKVKGVPALYLPYMYYPLSSDGRSTGFLMPSYGSSTYKGHTISNAFFWAINRSQDATFLHDWYSKTGQSIAGEYRYVSISGSGNFRSSLLNERPISYLSEGEEVEQAGRRSFNAFGNLSQSLGGSWYAQGRADYSSDLTVDQLYSTDISRASRRTRSYGGSVSGTTKGLRVTGIFDRNEYFAENGSSSVRGNNPRINIQRPDRLIGRLPVYASVTSEYVRIESKQFNPDLPTVSNGLHRFDVTPALRFPYNKIAFLGLNTTLRFPNTFWSQSQILDTVNGSQQPTRVDAPISRRFVEMSAEVNGPTFVRIWDAPKASYAQRFRTPSSRSST